MRQDWLHFTPCPVPSLQTSGWPTAGAPSNWLNEQTGPSGGVAFDRKEKEGWAGWEALPDISNLLCEEGESSAWGRIGAARRAGELGRVDRLVSKAP